MVRSLVVPFPPPQYGSGRVSGLFPDYPPTRADLRDWESYLVDGRRGSSGQEKEGKETSKGKGPGLEETPESIWVGEADEEGKSRVRVGNKTFLTPKPGQGRSSLDASFPRHSHLGDPTLRVWSFGLPGRIRAPNKRERGTSRPTSLKQTTS